MKPLNKNILPTNYKINFNLQSEDNFTGEETITLDVRSPSSKILLNGNNIKITKAVINDKPVKNISYNNDIITIDFERKISEGQHSLNLQFKSQYGHVTGLYKSHYDKGFMYTTQFEAAHAREAFPCVDEPIAKATFNISITVPEQLEALSNSKIIKKENKDNLVTYIFDTSPKMSTYLLYIGAGKFDSIEEIYQNKKIRIITVPGKAKKYGKFAMTATKQFLTFFENYFGIKYPLDKLDMIAVPDFGSGAMENWGAITFREDALLYNAKESSLAAKQRVAEVISHELVHQWFGNLVTMKWWNDLWLNESFADYMAYKAVAHHYPEMDPWADFLNKRVSGAYFLDSLNNSHPINVDVKSPVEIREVFDAISYSKGGMVLRMLESYIGEDSFKKGLHSYLTKNSYNNAEGNDLWKEISKFSDKPVEKIMDNWLNQMGYPVIEASLKGSKIKLSQKRFQFIDQKENKKWLIPISMDYGYILMENKTMEIDVKDWTKINVGEKGFFRVKYSPDLTQKIKNSLVNLDSVDQWGIYNDFFALCLSREIDLTDYLEIVELYKKQDYIVVDEILGNLNKLSMLTDLSQVKEVSKEFCKNLLNKFGWEKIKDEKETDGALRSVAIGKLGRLDDPEVLNKIKIMFKNLNSVHPDMRATVYKLTAWQGNEKTYKQLFDLYKKSENPEDKVQLLASLAWFKDEDLLKKSLELALSKDVRHQNIIYLIGNMCNNPHGKDLVWPWIKKNYVEIKKIFSHYVWHFNSILSYLSLLADTKLGKEIKTFLDEDSIPGTQRALAQMIEKMNIYEKFLEAV